MYTIISNILSGVTQSKTYFKKTLAHITGKWKLWKNLQYTSEKSLEKTLAWNKLLPQILSTTTKNLQKLKIIINQESVSHALKNVAFAVNNLFQQNHSKVIKPTKLLQVSCKSNFVIYLMLYLHHSIRL